MPPKDVILHEQKKATVKIKNPSV